MYVPHVTELVNGYEVRYDIFSRLLKDRIIYITGPLNQETCSYINGQLLFLASEPDKDIKIYMDSPGGSVTSGMSVYDVMQYIDNDIDITVVGQCASMAALILSGGTKGKRKALPNSTVLVHQPLLYGLSGQASDIEIHAKETLRWKKELNRLLSENTGQDLDVIEKATDRDFIMTAEMALEFGIIDKILYPGSLKNKVVGTIV